MVDRRPKRRQADRGDGARLREDLLRAGGDILAGSTGVADLTVRTVCDRVSVAPASFYLHFAGRDEFLYELAYRRLGDSEATLALTLAAVDDAFTRVEMRGESYVNFALSNPDLYRVLFMGSGHESTPTRFEEAGTFADTGLGALSADVAQAMTEGTIAAGDPDAVAAVLWMSQHGFASLLISLPDFPWPTVAALRSTLSAFTGAALAGPAQHGPVPPVP